jgi:hypothetical protein
MEKFITIAVLDYIHEIQILKHRSRKLYFFENEIMSFFRMYSNALGGIKLKIHPNDFEKKTILQEMKYDNNLKSFNFVVNTYLNKQKKKLNLKFFNGYYSVLIVTINLF